MKKIIVYAGQSWRNKLRAAIRWPAQKGSTGGELPKDGREQAFRQITKIGLGLAQLEKCFYICSRFGREAQLERAKKKSAEKSLEVTKTAIIFALALKERRQRA